eukprot:scaffold9087_cov142-Skeletonema_dohrnii-CCMP3373.AAC.1
MKLLKLEEDFTSLRVSCYGFELFHFFARKMRHTHRRHRSAHLLPGSKLYHPNPIMIGSFYHHHDTFSYREGRGGGPWGMGSDSMKRYALDTMREMPMDIILLCGGVQWMKEDSVESIMQDQYQDRGGQVPNNGFSNPMYCYL